jgi:hypothetical protein
VTGDLGAHGWAAQHPWGQRNALRKLPGAGHEPLDVELSRPKIVGLRTDAALPRGAAAERRLVRHLVASLRLLQPCSSC